MIMSTLQLVFAVFAEGVYRHDCVGIFTTLDKAREAAVDVISREPDSHHLLRIHCIELDRVKDMGGAKLGRCAHEPAVMTVRRNSNEVVIEAGDWGIELGSWQQRP